MTGERSKFQCHTNVSNVVLLLFYLLKAKCPVCSAFIQIYTDADLYRCIYTDVYIFTNVSNVVQLLFYLLKAKCPACSAFIQMFIYCV